MSTFLFHLSLLFPQAFSSTVGGTTPLKPGSHSSLFCWINEIYYLEPHILFDFELIGQSVNKIEIILGPLQSRGFLKNIFTHRV